MIQPFHSDGVREKEAGVHTGSAGRELSQPPGATRDCAHTGGGVPRFRHPEKQEPRKVFIVDYVTTVHHTHHHLISTKSSSTSTPHLAELENFDMSSKTSKTYFCFLIFDPVKLEPQKKNLKEG